MSIFMLQEIVPVSFRINLNPQYRKAEKALRYTLALLQHSRGLSFETDTEIIVSDAADADIRISGLFLENYCSHRFDWRAYFREEPLIKCEDGRPDYLSTAFYMLSCLQEYGSNARDAYGRFPYEAGYQKHFAVVEKNLVNNCFDAIIKEIQKRQAVSGKDPQVSRIVLTHDIDSLFGSFPQDWLATLKDGNFKGFFSLLKASLAHPKAKSAWNTIREILEIEAQFGFSSIFFWLPVKGKSTLDPAIKNADYRIGSAQIRNLMEEVRSMGSVNGLHKSASHFSFSEEFERLPQDLYDKINRYHFLRFNIQNDFPVLSRNVSQDYSLGFAEEPGFRNNYSLPYPPYDVLNDRPFDFIEVPLNIMDRTLRNYKKLSPARAQEHILQFLESHKNDAVISILWHNQFFSPYKFKGWKPVYIRILQYCRAHNIRPITPEEIQKEYSINFDSL